MERTRFENGNINGARCDLYVHAGVIERIMPAGERPLDAPVTDNTVDLAGAFVYPGFRDAHCHIFSAAETRLGLDASGFRQASDLIKAGRRYLAETGRTAVYAKHLVDTTFDGARMPGKDVLDQISTAFPVIVERVCGHLASVNSVVLAALPVLRQRYPDGVILENDIDLLPSLRDLNGEDDFRATLAEVVRSLLAFGITAVSSNDFGRFGEATDELLLQKVLDEFPGFSYRSQYAPDLPFERNDLLMLAMKAGVRPAVKVFRDGSLGGRTAWLREPYADAPDTVGQDTLDDATHEAVFDTANRLGLQVMTHAIGDRAIARTLDAFEKTSDPQNPLRHAIVHAQITDDALLERMRRLNVLAIVQPQFTTSDAAMAPVRLGARYGTAYRFKQMADAGMRVAFSSDAPVESFNPLLTLQAAMLGKAGQPDTAFSFADALVLHTAGAAYVDFAETDCGRLEVGCRADFCTFDRDLVALPPAELAGQRPLLTVAGGHVYRQAPVNRSSPA